MSRTEYLRGLKFVKGNPSGHNRHNRSKNHLFPPSPPLRPFQYWLVYKSQYLLAAIIAVGAEDETLGVRVGIGIGIERTMMGYQIDRHDGSNGPAGLGAVIAYANGSIPIPIATPTPNRSAGPGHANRCSHQSGFARR